MSSREGEVEARGQGNGEEDEKEEWGRRRRRRRRKKIYSEEEDLVPLSLPPSVLPEVGTGFWAPNKARSAAEGILNAV